MAPAAGHRETLAYVATAQDGRTSAVVTVDLDEASQTCGTVVHRVDLPPPGHQWHELAWRAAAPETAAVPRGLVASGLPSWARYELDAAQNPRAPQIVHMATADDRFGESLYTSVPAARQDADPVGAAPGLSLVAGEWGPAALVARELDVRALFSGAYGHHLHVLDRQSHQHVQSINLGAEHQLVLAACPARQQSRVYGFAAVMISTVDLSGSVWLWHRRAQDGACLWAARKVITIAAERAGAAEPPPLLADFRAIPPLVSHVALSPDDRLLYVSCWGTGELRQYDVCDPFHPVLMGLVRLGGIARKQPHPRHPRRLLRGGPRMVQLSDDGRRLYVISALHGAWDRQFHRGGADGWLARCLADPNVGLSVDPELFVDFGDDRPQHVLLDECLEPHPGREARPALSGAAS
jgi:methanethiol oxidase